MTPGGENFLINSATWYISHLKQRTYIIHREIHDEATRYCDDPKGSASVVFIYFEAITKQFCS